MGEHASHGLTQVTLATLRETLTLVCRERVAEHDLPQPFSFRVVSTGLGLVCRLFAIRGVVGV